MGELAGGNIEQLIMVKALSENEMCYRFADRPKRMNCGRIGDLSIGKAFKCDASPFAGSVEGVDKFIQSETGGRFQPGDLFGKS